MEEMTIEQVRDMLAAEEDNGERAGEDTAAVLAEEARQALQAETGSPEEAEPPADADAGVPEQRSYFEGAVGLGVDIVEIERMKAIIERTPSFTERVFSPEERAYCEGTASPATHYALRFAAKEAVVKALGTGFSEGIWVHDIEVERASNGRPSVKLRGRALEVAEEQGVRSLALSLSFTRNDAVACAMAVTEASARASEKRKDPMEELAKQFKETRKMLDEL